MIRLAWCRMATTTKRTLALVTDTLALVGEHMPGVSQVTITAAGATVTVVPKPPASHPPSPPASCPTCGRR